MNRKIRYSTRILINFIRIPFLFLVSCGDIRMNCIQLLSPAAKVRTYRRGTVVLKRRNNIEEGVLLEAFQGEIRLNGCFINRYSTIVSMKSISIGRDVTIGPNVCIYDHDHNHSKNGDSPFVSEPIIVEDGAWIGANSTILKGVTIGKSAVIAAGAVINHSVPPYSIVGGVPGKIIGTV